MSLRLGKRQPLAPRCSICHQPRRQISHAKSMKNGPYLWCDTCDTGEMTPSDYDRLMRERP